MTYEEYTRLDRDAQVRACVNDMALVAASQDAISDVDDLAGAPVERNLKLKSDRRIYERVGAQYEAVALETGTEEATVRRIVEAYEEIDARRDK
jgi:hypothetical protein